MSREKTDYRNQLERIMEAFPGKEVLSVNEVSKWLKKDNRTVKKMFSFREGYGISIVQLAREMLN